MTINTSVAQSSKIFVKMASFFYNIVVLKTILDIPILDPNFILMPKILVSEGESL